MNQRNVTLTMVAGACLFAALAVRPRASAEAPPAAASASASAPVAASLSASAPASASAAPSGSAGVPPAQLTPPAPLTRSHIEGFPDSRSDTPKPADWASAEPLLVTRAPAACKAVRLREWVRVTCHAAPDVEVFGARVVGGAEEGVSIEDAPPVKIGRQVSDGLHVVFPLRRGDRRIVTIQTVTWAWRAYSPDENLLYAISALWLEGAPGPTLVVE